MNKKIFAISDIHGYYDETIQALKDAGYNEDDPSHLLVVCGDIFDRGEQSYQVYQWLYRLTQEDKAVVLKGNHEPMFIKWLEGDNDPFNYRNNGMNTTIDDFMHSTSDFKMYVVTHADPDASNGLIDGYTISRLWFEYSNLARRQILEEHPEILEWLKTRPDYFETEHFIFTHGAIDGQCPDWHHPHKDLYGRYMDWEACAWDDGSFFNSSIVNTDKTVVIGHFGTYHLREMYNIKDIETIYIPQSKEDALDIIPDKYSILVRGDKRVIAIDATTALSGKVNVLCIEDEKLI